MNASHARSAAPHAGHYYVPQPSLYPFILSGGMFLLALGFILLAIVTGYTVFETLSPTGILSRALIYGPGLALGWVFLLLIPLIWLTKPPFTPKIGGAPGGGH